MHACMFPPHFPHSAHTRTMCTWRDVFSPAETSRIALSDVHAARPWPSQSLAQSARSDVLFFVRRLEGSSACCIACQLSRPAHRLQFQLACVSPLMAAVCVLSADFNARETVSHTAPHSERWTNAATNSRAETHGVCSDHEDLDGGPLSPQSVIIGPPIVGQPALPDGEGALCTEGCRRVKCIRTI